jgi:hypothetical protein
MHLVTAYEWVGYRLTPIQLEYPDPPAVFDAFLKYNGFRNIETFHLGEASPALWGDAADNVSINVYQAETTADYELGARFLASLNVAHTNVLVLIYSPSEYFSFLNAYSSLLALPLLRSIQTELRKLATDLKEIDSPHFSAGGAGAS